MGGRSETKRRQVNGTAETESSDTETESDRMEVIVERLTKGGWSETINGERTRGNDWEQKWRRICGGGDNDMTSYLARIDSNLFTRVIYVPEEKFEKRVDHKPF